MMISIMAVAAVLVGPVSLSCSITAIMRRAKPKAVVTHSVTASPDWPLAIFCSTAV